MESSEDFDASRESWQQSVEHDKWQLETDLTIGGAALVGTGIAIDRIAIGETGIGILGTILGSAIALTGAVLARRDLKMMVQAQIQQSKFESQVAQLSEEV